MSLDYKQIFVDQYTQHIKRRGADRLLEWLIGSDFFTAPASTRFHAAYEGGLVEHSLNVYKVFMKKHFVEGEDDPESVAIVRCCMTSAKPDFMRFRTGIAKTRMVNGRKCRIIPSMTGFPMDTAKSPCFSSNDLCA